MRSVFDSRVPTPTPQYSQQVSILQSNLVTSPKRITLRYKNFSDYEKMQAGKFLPRISPLKAKSRAKAYIP